VHNHRQLLVEVLVQAILAPIDRVYGQFKVRLVIGVDGLGMGKQLLEEGVSIEDCIGTARKRAQIVLNIHQPQVYNYHLFQVYNHHLFQVHNHRQLLVEVLVQAILAPIDRVYGQFKVRLVIGVDGLGMGKQLLEEGVSIEDCIGTARKRAQIVLHIHELQVYNHHQLQVINHHQLRPKLQ